MLLPTDEREMTEKWNFDSLTGEIQSDELVNAFGIILKFGCAIPAFWLRISYRESLFADINTNVNHSEKNN